MFSKGRSDGAAQEGGGKKSRPHHNYPSRINTASRTAYAMTFVLLESPQRQKWIQWHEAFAGLEYEDMEAPTLPTLSALAHVEEEAEKLTKQGMDLSELQSQFCDLRATEERLRSRIQTRDAELEKRDAELASEKARADEAERALRVVRIDAHRVSAAAPEVFVSPSPDTLS